MPQIRDVNLLVPEFQPGVKRYLRVGSISFHQFKNDPDYDYFLVPDETLRLLSTQMAYYSRSRCPVQVVKDFFKADGLWAISDEEAKILNTKTLSSKHILGQAVDIGIFRQDKKNGSIDRYWPTEKEYDFLFLIAENECGMDACAGGKVGNKWKWDWNHYEYMYKVSEF